MMIMKNLTGVGPILTDVCWIEMQTYYNSIKAAEDFPPAALHTRNYAAADTAFPFSKALFLKYSTISAETTSRLSR